MPGFGAEKAILRVLRIVDALSSDEGESGIGKGYRDGPTLNWRRRTRKTRKFCTVLQDGVEKDWLRNSGAG